MLRTIAVCLILAGCASTADRTYVSELATEARSAATIECPESCAELWEAARYWATYDQSVKRVDLEPRQINAMTQAWRCRVNMTIDLKDDRLEVRATPISYGFLYVRSCGRPSADHAILTASRAIRSH